VRRQRRVDVHRIAFLSNAKDSWDMRNMAVEEGNTSCWLCCETQIFYDPTCWGKLCSYFTFGLSIFCCSNKIPLREDIEKHFKITYRLDGETWDEAKGLVEQVLEGSEKGIACFGSCNCV
jgi:hypothetical protein